MDDDEFARVVASIEFFPDWRLRGWVDGGMQVIAWHVLVLNTPPSVGVVGIDGPQVVIPRSVDDRYVVQMAYQTAIAMLLHEAGEWFTVGGRRLFDPHMSTACLNLAADKWNPLPKWRRD